MLIKLNLPILRMSSEVMELTKDSGQCFYATMNEPLEINDSLQVLLDLMAQLEARKPNFEGLFENSLWS